MERAWVANMNPRQASRHGCSPRLLASFVWGTAQLPTASHCQPHRVPAKFLLGFWGSQARKAGAEGLADWLSEGVGKPSCGLGQRPQRQSLHLTDPSYHKPRVNGPQGRVHNHTDRLVRASANIPQGLSHSTLLCSKQQLGNCAGDTGSPCRGPPGDR